MICFCGSTVEHTGRGVAILVPYLGGVRTSGVRAASKGSTGDIPARTLKAPKMLVSIGIGKVNKTAKRKNRPECQVCARTVEPHDETYP